MRRILFTAFIILLPLLSGCVNARKGCVTIPENKECSILFRQLYTYVSSQTNSFADTKKFEPDSAHIEKFSISKSEDGFYIKGYMFTKPKFDKSVLDNIDILTVMYNDTMYSYMCPLLKIDKFVNTEGIKAIDIDKTIFIDKPFM